MHRGVADRCVSCGGYWFERYAFASCVSATDSELDVRNIADSIPLLQGAACPQICSACEDMHLKECRLGESSLLVCSKSRGLFVSADSLDKLIKALKRLRNRETAVVLGELVAEATKVAVSATMMVGATTAIPFVVPID